MTTCEPLPAGGSERRMWPTPRAEEAAHPGRVKIKPGQQLHLAAAVQQPWPPPMPAAPEDDPQLTLWPEDSPASPSASPGRASPRRIAGGSGQHSRTSFADYDPASCSWKTSRVSLDGEWETYSETWPPSGMTRTGIAYRLPQSAPRTSASASGSWPIPQARDHRTGQPHRVGDPARHGGWNLNDWAAMWPTPKGSAANYGRPRENDRGDLQAAVLRWPTPVASDAGKDRGSSAGWGLRDAAGGSLNPTWVEWLMGYPAGWTDCEDSGTPSSPRSPSTSDG